LRDGDKDVDTLTLLLTVATGLASSIVLAGAKKWTGVLDTKLGKVVKPLQPLLVLGLAVVLPKLGAATGIMPPDATQLVDAPTATLTAVVAREVLARVFGKKEKV
jgi:hypothetical protein